MKTVHVSRQTPLYLGTMGFSYKDWNGVFYPVEMNAKSYLSYYSRIFNSVEIDSSFYGTPKKSTIQGWVNATPEEFKFSVKVPLSITHELGLVNAWGMMAEFLDSIRLLGSRLGVILFQFPPSFTTSEIDKLAVFLEMLPDDLRFAFEVRDQSWYTAEDKVENLLEKYGVAWAATQYPNLPAKIHQSANFAYIRWIGQHGSFQRHDHERIDRTEDLQKWWSYIQETTRTMSAIFGYFNNDYAGFAAGTALKFRYLAGIPGEMPQQPKQPKLF
jgi:uncharacterized protein YecE (DUF72 family)